MGTPGCWSLQMSLFLVADKAQFNWRTAPTRRYESFSDFYNRELAKTWGDWHDLQEDWAKVVKGEQSGEQAIKAIEGRLRAKAGRPPKGEEKPYNIRIKNYGTRANYTLARLDRDRPDLAARVRVGGIGAGRDGLARTPVVRETS